MKALESVPLVDTDPNSEWKGFWTDPETGLHWGSIHVVHLKTDVGRSIIEHYFLPKLKLEKRFGSLKVH